ncbi:sensor histidine kinase [Haloferula sargassicola]|uniref:histidine kinase n=1 Tax=Haloferula sargassicola TaxID=490096 RepID=A0ABP9UXC2_9BACT
MSGRCRWIPWLALPVCGAIILAAMGWLTHGVMRAEHERSLAESRARLEERIRLSLWRMDTLAASVAIEENQRVINATQDAGESPLVRLRFRVDRDGRVIPDGSLAEETMTKLRALLSGQRSSGDLYQFMCATITGDNQWRGNMILADQPKEAAGDPYQPADQQMLNFNERASRGKAVNRAVTKAGLEQKWGNGDAAVVLASSAGAFQPTWIGDEPFLMRLVKYGDVVRSIEGVWLDKTAFRRLLLDEIADLLPLASLEPSTVGGEGEMTLASFPWKLVPGEAAAGPEGVGAAVIRSLAVGWLAVIVALVAGTATVLKIMRLSERRAAFVSAVTHELRTPLTTFRLYSDLLAGGLVKDEEKKARYFETMRRESDRLVHLVENVLSFSRIERKASPETERVVVAGFLESLRERFESRLESAGLDLVLQVEGDPVARANKASVEHILFNLIDNAGKYADRSQLKQVELVAGKFGRRVRIQVIDHGPGIPPAERWKIFRPFHKSADEAAGSKPGVGLGLALSRRLARDLGGELTCSDGDGATFVLELPSA